MYLFNSPIIPDDSRLNGFDKIQYFHISQLPIEHPQNFLNISLKLWEKWLKLFQELVLWINIKIFLQINGLYHLEEGTPVVVFHLHSHIKSGSEDEIAVLSGGGSSWLRLYILLFTILLSRTRCFYNHTWRWGHTK